MEKITPLKIGVILLACGLLILYYSQSSSTAKLKKAVITLNKLGAKFASRHIDEKDEELIAKLAVIPTPILKSIEHKAVLTSAISYETLDSIVLNSLNGHIVEPCGQVIFYDNFIKVCDNVIKNPPEALRNALGIIKPIQGVIHKNGKEIPAKFVVNISILYKGSHCQTHIGSGSGSQECVKKPRRRRR